MGRPRKNPDDPKWLNKSVKEITEFQQELPVVKVPAKRGRTRITFKGEPVTGADASTYVGRQTNFFWKLWQDTAHSHPEHEAMKEQFIFWVKKAQARGLKVAGDEVA